MIEAIAAAVEKVAEASVEKTVTFLDKLEASVEVVKPEIVKQEEAAKAFWDGLEAAVENDNKIEKAKELRQEHIPLTDDEKNKIKEETGWSDEIIDSIRNMDEYEKVYKNAELHEATIDGRKCLVKNIDMDYVDPKTGLTNRGLMARGRSPIDAKTGEKIELHHMGQDSDSPFAELCENSEHGDGNDATLHDNNVESWRRDPDLKNQYDNVQRPNHWKERAKEA